MEPKDTCINEALMLKSGNLYLDPYNDIVRMIVRVSGSSERWLFIEMNDSCTGGPCGPSLHGRSTEDVERNWIPGYKFLGHISELDIESFVAEKAKP